MNLFLFRTLLLRCALCLAALLILVGSGVFYAAVASTPRLDIHYVPTPHKLVQRMLEMAEVNSNDIVYDLGSGDGRIVIAAVRDFNARKGLGIDLDPERIAEANENARSAGVTNRVTFEQGDLFQKDLSEATVVTLYLLSSLNLRLRPTLLDMTPGTRIVSHAFDMGDWSPDLTDSVDGYLAFLWIVPAQVEGNWQVQTADGRSFTLTLRQSFQQLDGHVVNDGKQIRLSEATLSGAELSFAFGTDRFVGRVEGDAIRSTTASTATQEWHARRN